MPTCTPTARCDRGVQRLGRIEYALEDVAWWSLGAHPDMPDGGGGGGGGHSSYPPRRRARIQIEGSNPAEQPEGGVNAGGADVGMLGEGEGLEQRRQPRCIYFRLHRPPAITGGRRTAAPPLSEGGSNGDHQSHEAAASPATAAATWATPGRTVQARPRLESTQF